jgi:hypothetical protein
MLIPIAVGKYLCHMAIKLKLMKTTEETQRLIVLIGIDFAASKIPLKAM